VLAGSQPGSDVVQQLEAELAAMELEQVSLTVLSQSYKHCMPIMLAVVITLCTSAGWRAYASHVRAEQLPQRLWNLQLC
jgi:hypothetical protein